jgi:intein-encoded DNA endonuclease-like protein
MGKLRQYRHRTLEERLKLHSQVQELRAKGLQVKEIAQALGMSRRDVSYWLRVKRPSRTVYAPDLSPRPELAYLVGAYLGDGRTAGEQDKKVRFNVADSAFADLLNELLAKVIRRNPKPVPLENGFYSVSYDSAVLYDYLQQPLSGQRSLIDYFPAMFLRGFFDAEGYVTLSIDRTSRTLLAIRVGAANCNLDYIDFVRRSLSILGISSTQRKTNKEGGTMEIRGRTYLRKRDVYHVEINNLNHVRAYGDQVGFSVPQKNEKLRDLLTIMTTLDPKERYEWFTSNYEKVGHRWLRKRQ